MTTGTVMPKQPLVPVRSGNVFEDTMEALLRGIRLGQFPAGGKLPPERELSQALRVSRTTLREVLAELSKNGYVSARRGRYGGTYVAEDLPPISGGAIKDLDVADVLDLLTLRRVVEPAAAGLAATRGVSDEQAAALWVAHEECCQVGPAQYRPLDSRLHLMIADLSGSTRLRAVIEQTRVGVNDLLDCIPLLPSNLEHSAQQHEAIVAAIAAGQAISAERAMVDHVDGTAALLRGFLG